MIVPVGCGLSQRSNQSMLPALDTFMVLNTFYGFIVATDFKCSHINLPKCFNSSLNTKGPLNMLSGWDFTNIRNSSD